MNTEYKSGIPTNVVELAKSLPALRYMKAPVTSLRELYEKYPNGLERGAFAFAYNTNTFYSWSFEEKTWKPVDGSNPIDMDLYFNLYNLLDVDSDLQEAPVGSLLYRKTDNTWGIIPADEVRLGVIKEVEVSGDGNAFTSVEFDTPSGKLSFVRGQRFLLPEENAASASQLEQAVNVELTGAIRSETVLFDGSEDLIVPVISLDATKLTEVVPTDCLTGEYGIDISGSAGTLVNSLDGEAKFKFWIGTEREFDALTEKDEFTIYHIV